MATITTTVTDMFTMNPGQSWNYWFYPRNGQWQADEEIDKDQTVLYPIARPHQPTHWDIDGDDVTVILESDTVAPRYRHRYALLVKNLNQSQARRFFIVVSELKP